MRNNSVCLSSFPSWLLSLSHEEETKHWNKSGYRHRYQSAPIGLVLVGMLSVPLGQWLAGNGLYAGFEFFFPMLALLQGFSGHCGVCSSKSSFQPPLFSFHRTFYLKAQDVNQLETAALLEAGTCKDSDPCSSKPPRTLKTSAE